MAISAEQVAVILLAAGRSERFGPEPKLLAPLLGQPLGLASALVWTCFPFARHIAIVSGESPDFGTLGYDCYTNPNPKAGQSQSIRLGVKMITDGQIEAVFIALADMPFVGLNHIQTMLDAYDDRPVASIFGRNPMPPALFPRSRWPNLMALEGDQGARSLLSEGHWIPGDLVCLSDIDTQEQLSVWNGIMAQK
jgi:molybdenum cofactor cytidylyltransferase